MLGTLPDQSVDSIVTDPPYGTTDGRSKREMRGDSTVSFGFDWDKVLPTAWLKEAARVIRPGGSVMVFTDNRAVGHLWDAGEAAGLSALQTFYWEKPDSTPNPRKNFSSAVESGVFFRAPGKVLCWNGGGWCRNIFRAPLAHKETDGVTRYHPTEKPVSLMRWLVELVTPPGGLVLDPFMGSGSTGVAALLGGRRFSGVELNDDYVQTARNRLSSTAWGGGNPWQSKVTEQESLSTTIDLDDLLGLK